MSATDYHVGHVVADHDHAVAVLAEALDQVEHLRGLGDTEGRCRLIEDDDLRVAEQGPGDRHGLALATRERRDGDAHGGDLRRQLPEQLPGLDLHRHVVEPGGAQLLTEEQVLDDVEVLAQGEVLVDGGDPKGLRIGGRVNTHALALERDRSRVGGMNARQHLDEGRFAGTVVTDEGHDLALMDGEVDAGQGGHSTEVLGHPSQGEDLLAHAGGPVDRRGCSWGGAGHLIPSLSHPAA